MSYKNKDKDDKNGPEIETFWGATAYTPAHNRLYNAPPFGWESYNNPTDFPRCTANPYASTTAMKIRLNKENKHTCPECHLDKYIGTPEEIYKKPGKDSIVENFGPILPGRYRKRGVQPMSRPHAGVYPVDVKSSIRTAAIITFVCVALLALFHEYK